MLRRQRQVVGRAADQLSLLFGAIEEPEAVLKAPAVSDFCPEFQRILGFLQLKFKLYNIADFNVAWKRGAEAALGNVLGPAMQRSRSLNDNTTVQGIPRMRSRQGPWMLFLLRHNPKTLSQCAQKTGFTGELLAPEFLDGPTGMLTEDWIGVLFNLFQIGQELRVSAVAHGDDNVSPEPRIFGALDRRPTKDAAVGVFIHLRQPAQFGVV